MEEVFRHDMDKKEYPMIVKASTAGTLETLLKEVEKEVKRNPHVQVIDYGVGPVTEADILTAMKTGAVIFGFDVNVSPPLDSTAVNCCIHLHKLIHRFISDVAAYAEEADIEEILENEIEHHGHKHHQNECTKNVEVLGTAKVRHIYDVTEKPPYHHTSHPSSKKIIEVAGATVSKGEIARKNKFRVIRNETVLQDGLTVHSMKKLKDDITQASKGLEFGISFENFKHGLL